MWLICLHVVVCVCLYGLYRDDMSQGSTEYWVASSAVHPSKTLDFGSLGEKPHGGFRFLSWSKWRWPLYVLSLEASSCICDPNTLQNIADMFQIAPWDILRLFMSGFPLQTLLVWFSMVFLSRELLMSFRLLVLKPWLSVFELGHQMQQNIMGRSLSPHPGLIFKSWLLLFVFLHIHFGSCCWLKFSKISNGKVRKSATCSDTEELLAAATVQCDAKAPAK